MTASDERPENTRRKGLTDQQADMVAILVIVAALLAGVIHFLTG
jgi:hypothetical protein